MKILLVEDEEKLNKYISESLRQQGYVVESCFDGKKALDYVDANYESLDLIVLDIILPGLSGLEICKNVRDVGISTPILILTAKDQTEDKISGLDMGADDYLTKPFSLDELIARVKALLRRPNTIQPEEIKISDLTVNLKNGEIAIGKNIINLTLKEYRIIEFLARNRGMTIERDEILDKLWDNGYETFSNTVDVHVKNLRKKLGGYGKLIETIRGLGYRFSQANSI